MERRLKRVVIKEELVELTGDMQKAVILNQFIYWSERVQDFDKFVSEERNRMEQEGRALDMSPANGWVYKSADEMIEETMLGISQPTMSRHLQALVDAGYLLRRNNPEHKWDRKKQYRVDFVKVRGDLAKLGYSLEGYPFFNLNNASFTMNNREFKLNNQGFMVNNQTPKNEYAITEITTKTTTEITTNNNNGTVAAVQEHIESYLGKPISSLADNLPDWIRTYGEERLLEVAKFISKENKWSNPVGAFRSAIEKKWDIHAIAEIAAGTRETTATGPNAHVRDERYAAFYELFPDS